MLFFILNILALFIASFIVNYFSVAIFSNLEEGMDTSVFIFWASILITAFPIINIGPVRAGFEAVFRNYAREEHSFIWSEYKENMRSNFKQSSLVSLLNLGVFIFLMLDVLLIRGMVFKSTIIWTLYNSFFILVLLIYAMINIYIYPMMVTFELSIKNLIKNSLMFAFVRFLPNLLILIIFFGVLSAPFFILNPVFAVFLSFLLLYGVMGFMLSFFAQRGFKKYMIDKIPEKKRRRPQ